MLLVTELQKIQHIILAENDTNECMLFEDALINLVPIILYSKSDNPDDKDYCCHTKGNE